MDKNQSKALSIELAQAVSAILKKHNLGTSVVSTGGNESGILLTVTFAGDKAKPSANAVSRYKKFGAKLGLPTLGTMMMVAGKEYALVGLSSDGARVKALLNQPGAAVVDLPLSAVQAAIAAAGAKIVKEQEKAEQAQPDDVVDPNVTAMLGAIGAKAAKPAEGQQ
jgi:tetrahydromethanopterin S-methyltransferase subunit C